MQNNQLKNIAEKIIAKIPDQKTENFTSIITILMIISIILTVIRVLQECNKSKLSMFTGKDKTEYFAQQIKDTAIRRTWFSKMILKKAIRKELGRENYKIYGLDLMNAMLDTAEELKENELYTLAEAANV